MSDAPDLIYFDERVDDRVRGWFTIPSEEDRYQSAPIEITIGAFSFGYALRSIDRPDVDAILPLRGAGPKGFALPLCALFVFARLCRSLEDTGLSVRIGDRTFRDADFEERLRDPELLTTLRWSLKAETLIHIADVWFAAATTLRLRLDGVGPDLTLRFYQTGSPSNAPAGIVYVGEALRTGGADQIIDVALENPFAPLLLTLFDSNDVLIGADILPFPSLCRGGVHAAELAALGPTGDPSADLRSVGGSLLVDLLDSDDEGERFARLVVDARTATGTEAVFSASMVSWLRYLGIGIGLSGLEQRVEGDGGDPSAADHLRSLVEATEPVRWSRTDNGGHLALTANAVPTISALITRRFWSYGGCDPRSLPCIGSLIVDGGRSGAARWLVRQSGAEQRVGVRLDDEPSCFPILTPPDGRTVSPLAANLPLAIRAKAASAISSLTLLHPVMHPRGAKQVTNASAVGISVLVIIGENCNGLDALLSSLTAQSYAGALEIVIHQCGASSAVLTEVTIALESSFAGRFQVLRCGHAVPRGVAFEALARAATMPFVLITDEMVVLQDDRTLEVLSTMVAVPGVGSASCMILKKGKVPGEYAVHSAGYLPGRLDYTAGSAADVTFIDTFDLLGPSTYTVVANTSDLMLTKRDLWLVEGEASTRSYPRTRFDVDFGVRVIEAGQVNVVTTTIAAICMDVRERRQSMDLHAPFLADVARLSRAFESSLTARRL